MTLTEFLLARIAEREAAIEHWDSDGKARIATMWTGGEPGYTTVASDHADGVWVADGREVDDGRHCTVLFDPAYVLADCEAKRRIVELHAVDCYVGTGPDGDDEYFCSGCHAPGGPHPDDVRCPTLRALALPYADHPDYRAEWKP